MRPEGVPQVVFAGNNLSEDYIAELMDLASVRNTACVVISKSGTTTEPAVAFRIVKEHIEKTYGKAEASSHFLLHPSEQFGVVFGQFLLRRNGYYLPVGLVHGGQDVLILLVVGGAGQFLGQIGYAVRRHDFAAGEDWLLQADSGNENVVHVPMR